MRSALLIDLDDTLYEERDYVDSGFRHVASLVAADSGIAAETLLEYLRTTLRARGRGRLFDDLLIAHGLPATPEDVTRLVDAYRAHRPSIALAETVIGTLHELRRRFAIAIVTDGLELMQRRKTEALSLADAVDTIVYCWEHDAPKPSVEPYRIALQRLGDPPIAGVVGDDVSRDLPAAVALGAPFVRIRQGRFMAHATPSVSIPVVEVASFSEVPAAVARLEATRTGAL